MAEVRNDVSREIKSKHFSFRFYLDQVLGEGTLANVA